MEMSELIKGREVFEVLERGDEVEYKYKGTWLNGQGLRVCEIRDDSYEFRLKPRTITINEIEVPAPFEPKEGEIYWYLTDSRCGYGCIENKEGCRVGIAAWRTEDEIKQVVAALRSIFSKG
jgi:hypothetical protein